MTIESSTYIGDWVAANPASTDPKSEGDDHIRKIKLDIQATFPGLIGRFRRTQSKSSAYTAVLNDNASILVTSSTWTLSLTAAATLGNGWEIMVYNNGAGTITVDPNSTETINGATTLAIATNTYVWIACNGSSFFAAGSPTNSVNLVTTDTTQTITGDKTHNNDFRVGINTAAQSLHINGAAGQNRSVQWETAGSLRFWDIIETTAESGSNAGSNRRFLRYSDSATQLGDWLQVRRSDGAVQAGNAPTGGFAGADIWNFKATPRVNNSEVLFSAAFSTFTPTVTLVGGTGNVVPVYTTNTGRYRALGSIVFVDVYLTGDGGAEGAGDGQINIALPVTASSNHPTFRFPVGSYSNGANQNFLQGEIDPSGTTIKLYISTSNTAFQGTDQSQASRDVRLKFFYESS